MGRGQLNKQVQEKAKSFLGREMDVRELRLIPYIQYTMVNSQKIDPRHINQEEREILQKWKETGHVEGGITGLAITKEFWDFMCEILWNSYVITEIEGE